MQLVNHSALTPTGGHPLHPEVSAPPAGLIVGLGNSLLCDDGIGVHAVRLLAADPPAGTLPLEVGTDVFSAVSWLECVPRVLVIDALEGGGKPGTIYKCRSSDICNPKPMASLHELGLLSVLEFIPRDRWPDITVLGVQPALIQFGLELSPALQVVLPAVVDAARAITAGWVSPGRTALLHHQSPMCQPLTR